MRFDKHIVAFTNTNATRERERESNSQLESLHNSAFTCNDKNTICHIERSEISQNISDRDISAFSKPQYDKTRDCHESAYTDSRNDSIICHTEGEIGRAHV